LDVVKCGMAIGPDPLCPIPNPQSPIPMGGFEIYLLN